MGNEYASYGQQQSVVGKQTLSGSQELEMCVPGKSTLAEAEMSSVEGDVARVAQRAGERVVDKGHFEYIVQADGSFEISKAPVPFTASKGRRITVAELPSVWGALHDMLLAQPSQSAKTPKPAARPSEPRSQEAMAANEARVRSNQATIEGSTLDIAKTKADQGNAGTHYKRLDLTQPEIKRMMTGDKDAAAFYCSGFAMWTLAAAGYDLDSPILGSDGKPFSYTTVAKSDDAATVERFRKSERLMKQITDAGIELAADEFPSSGKITFRKIIDGDPVAMELITKIEREALGPGVWLGVHRNRGTVVFDEMIDGVDNTTTAAKGLAGAFELFGIGREVPELEQKPGDFAQTRKKVDGAYTGAGHAFQVWSVRATGSAMFGQDGSPKPVTDDGAKGWKDNVDFIIDKDTNPALVGEHAIVSATRIEANIEGAMVPEQKAKAEKGKKAPAGDGGVQVTGDVEVPAKGGKGEDLVVFYGRLASSPWMTWTKATKPQ